MRAVYVFSMPRTYGDPLSITEEVSLMRRQITRLQSQVAILSKQNDDRDFRETIFVMCTTAVFAVQFIRYMFFARR